MSSFNPNPYSKLQSSGETMSKDAQWLTDIEKVQAEIAKDLAMTQSPNFASGTASGSGSSSEWILNTPNPKNMFHGASVEPPVDSSIKPVCGPSLTQGFYRETIKAPSQNTRIGNKTIVVVFLICIFGMSSLGFGLGAAIMWVTGHVNTVSPDEIISNTETPTITSNRYIFEIGEQQPGTVADMVALLEPAVVSITTIFEEGIRDSIAGSGTIFAETDDRIFIATGSYVVPAGNEYQVRISGSRPLPARFVNNNRAAGLAVISVEKALLFEAGIESITIASFGDSSLMQVGNVVFAIGNARNEGISVTRGIISADKQELAFLDYNLTVLQTDAAINYGSSGGPLININGEVIGINIDRATVMFGNAAIEGIGYSIASNEVVPALEELINPTTPGLGIIGQTVNEEIAAFFGIPPMGVLVTGVTPGGAAEAAGMQRDDIITSFDREPVFIMEELQQAIRQRQIGDEIEVRILRDGTTITLYVVLRALVPQ